MSTSSHSFANLGQGNAELVYKTFGAFSKGAQTFASEIFAFNKSSLERNAALFQDLAGARSLERTLEIQANYWKSSAEELTQEMSKLGQLWMSMMAATAPDATTAGRKSKPQ